MHGKVSWLIAYVSIASMPKTGYYVVDSVESFAHIECYSDSSRRGSHLVEPLCDGVVKRV